MTEDTGIAPSAQYKSLRTVTAIIIVLVIIQAAVSFATPYFNTLELISIPLSIASLILILLWFYRAHSNLGALAATELKFTPRWAVIWWFIPILNFWKPYRVTVEIMKASDPAVGHTDGAIRNAMERPNLVLFWWIYSFFAIAVSFGLLYWYGIGNLSELNNNPSSPIKVISLFVSCTGAVGAWLELRVIRQITKRQDKKIELMRSGAYGAS